MLTIVTDIKDTSWLHYIIEEWHRIQDAKFDFKIVDDSEYLDLTKEENTLYYTSFRPKGNILWIPRSECRGNTIIEKDDYYFLKDSLVSSAYDLIPFDIFWNAFYFLSRKEEYDTETNGVYINSYSGSHPRINKQSFEKPIVNVFFSKIEKMISDKYPLLQFGRGEGTHLELSHDLDYIEKTMPLLLKQTAMNSFKTIKSLGSPSTLGQNIKRTFTFLFQRPSYWCFDYWNRVESEFEKKSVFYVYTKTKKRNFKQWLLDPSYSIKDNIPLQDELKRLLDQGHEIGLHGSFFSAENKELLEEEKYTLEKAIGRHIHKGRQHWLRFREQTTPYIHEELSLVDSTIGFNDRIGFRAGICSEYRPYSHKDQRAFNYFVIPQFIMDSNIFEYSLDSKPQELTSQTINILDSCINKFKNVHLALSWHPRTASSDYNWHHEYERLINFKKSII